MALFIMRGLFRLLNFFRIILYPLIKGLLPLLSEAFRDRVNFERVNKTDPLSISFKKDQLEADWGLEVSSEGELEQVIPLIREIISQEKKIELYFASPSVEEKCRALAKQNPNQIRILRLPLLSYFPKGLFGGQDVTRWATSKKLILCRYDFYPELMLPQKLNSKALYLVSGTLKGKQIEKSDFKQWLLHGLFSAFDTIIAATELDRQRFLRLGIGPAKLTAFDFRVLQVFNRVENKMMALQKQPFWTHFEKYIGSFPFHCRLILGSVWKNELPLLLDAQMKSEILKGSISVLLAPHQLGTESIEEFQSSWKMLSPDIPIYILSDKGTPENYRKLFLEIKLRPGIVILTSPGILVEVYSYFGNAYVGGGFGRSIHSVLEPYLAGANVFCGPRTHRSTEYDFVIQHSPSHIHIVEELNQFYSCFKKIQEFQIDSKVRIGQVVYHQKEFIKMLEKYFPNPGKGKIC
ncbi:MAG: hypothetical protein HN509_14290 [Halobacteriovoraceae bacterium]|jgi:3-deoxy-D-manno-octulosonic-acid transferase|nr:hypothetical protein [Halobacteriovoraceae bacterium]MBT5095840.1 hypothetical protein [Halobacteriovoraceae bacterium]